MRILGTIAGMRHRFCHGGCEVLRVLLDVPAGDTVAARHFVAMTEALEDYAKGELYPTAVNELEALAAEGRAHDFRRHHYRAVLSEREEKRDVLVTLSVTHSRDEGKIVFHKKLHTLWSKDGAFQRKNKKKGG